MIYPIVAYGDPILRKVTRLLEKGEINLQKLSNDLFETMHESAGVGLAAPQVGLGIRVFVVDGTAMNEDEEEEDKDPTLEGFKKIFINPEIIEEDGDDWAFEEGCLSIPGIRGEVYRPEIVTIRYLDIDWNEQLETYEGMAARIIQHEYDHLHGKLFTDYLPALKRQLLKRKLSDISRGIVDVDYRMRFHSRR
jgi:peptide deformylase